MLIQDIENRLKAFITGTRLFVIGSFGLLGLATACTSSAPTTTEAPAPPIVEVEVTLQSQPTQQPTATQTTESQSAADPIEALTMALQSKDYAALNGMLAASFSFAPIASEPSTLTSADFLVQLQNNYLGPGSVTVDLNRDIQSEVSPDYANLLSGIARVLYSRGWGTGGTDTALLFLDSEGNWTGMLYMFEGLEELLFETLPSSGTAFTNFADYRTALLDALTSGRDYATLQSLMGDPFIIGIWESEGVQLTPQAAAEQLRTSYLPPAAFINYQFDADMTTMLGGTNPLTMWNPSVNVVSAFFSDGWGTDGNGEAIVVTALRDDGTYYWYSLLYSPRGF